MVMMGGGILYLGGAGGLINQQLIFCTFQLIYLQSSLGFLLDDHVGGPAAIGRTASKDIEVMFAMIGRNVAGEVGGLVVTWYFSTS